MLPQRFAKTAPKGLPLPLLVVGGVLVLALLVFAGVAATMGSAPAQTETTVDVPLE